MTDVLVAFPGNDVQTEYEQMEQDFADDRRRIARKIDSGDVVTWEQFTGNNPFGPDLTHRHCVFCGGSFAPVTRVMAFWSPIGPRDVQFLHVGCFCDAEAWAK